MKAEVWHILLVVLVVTVFFAAPARADVTVFVGYADNLRSTGFFPSPWDGSAGVTLFAASGSNNKTCAPGGGSGSIDCFDAGAIRIENTGASDVTVNSLVLTLHPTASPALTFNLWGGSLGAGFVLHPGDNAIFSQTSAFNFDTSDFPIVGQDISNNCSVGALSSTATCTDNAPKVEFTLDGSPKDFSDTKHVLDTGGFDANCCLPNGNESLNWREIGTTGVENPGGTVPEPSSIALFGTSLLGCVALLRRKLRKQN